MFLPSSNPTPIVAFIVVLWQTPPGEPDPLAIVVGVFIVLPLWIFFITRGIKAAKESGRSPHWMWFGIHPLGALIAFLILRYLAKNRTSVTQVDAETAILQAAASAGGSLTLARAAQAARLPAEQVQVLLDKFTKLGVAEIDVNEKGAFLYVFPGLADELSAHGKQFVQAPKDYEAPRSNIQTAIERPRLSEPAETAGQKEQDKSPLARLEQLEKLKQQALISDIEYALKKAEILREL